MLRVAERTSARARAALVSRALAPPPAVPPRADESLRDAAPPATPTTDHHPLASSHRAVPRHRRPHRSPDHVAPWTTPAYAFARAFAHERANPRAPTRSPRSPPAPPLVVDRRAFASKVKGTARPRPARPPRPDRPPKGSSSPRDASALPPLKEAMRRLVRLVHPDLFASGPAGAAEVNDESLKAIQGVLDSITRSKRLPDAGVRRLRFYVRDPIAPEGVRLVPFTFKTTGGDCRNLVAKQLRSLFDAVGVRPSAFRWEAGDWEHAPERAANASARGDENQNENQNENEPSRRSRGAPGMDLYPGGMRAHETTGGSGGGEGAGAKGGSSGSSAATKTLAAALKINDKLFEAIAAVPWIPEPRGDDRVRAINAEIIPRLSREGWAVSREKIEAVWRGERDDAVAMEGVDAASALAMGAIVRHAKNFDRVYGKPNKERENFYP